MYTQLQYAKFRSTRSCSTLNLDLHEAAVRAVRRARGRGVRVRVVGTPMDVVDRARCLQSARTACIMWRRLHACSAHACVRPASIRYQIICSIAELQFSIQPCAQFEC